MIYSSRKAAISFGEKAYFTGKPCVRGNIDFRYAATGGCLCNECKESRRNSCKNHYQANKDYYAKKTENYYSENAEKIKQMRRERGASNREKERDAAKAYYWINRDKCIESAKRYIKEHKAKTLQRLSVRRAKSKMATPAWADKEKIKMVYLHAQLLNCWDGPRAEVDHIVPLVSDLVCGLHCEQNLQILWKSENSKKGNRYWPDMPGAKNGNL